jgi:hypothetical protein
VQAGGRNQSGAYRLKLRPNGSATQERDDG